MAVQPDDQLALDERQINDSVLEGLLDDRLRKADDLAEVRKVFKGADEAAKAAIAILNLADEDAVRVGRFRITKTAVEARHVEFDAEATTRVRISLAEDEPAATKPRHLRSVSDDADLKPAAPVNTDALRGEVDRAAPPDAG